MSHALDQHLRTTHRLRRIHGSDAHGPTSPADGPLALASRSPRLAAPPAQVGALPRLDAQMRISLAGALAAVGWVSGDLLVVSVDVERATAALLPFDPACQKPGQQTVRVDAAHRVALPSSVRSALRLVEGDQVLVAATPGRPRLALFAASAVLASLTGAVSEAPAPPQEPRRLPNGPRPRWRPVVVAGSTTPASHSQPCSGSTDEEE